MVNDKIGYTCNDHLIHLTCLLLLHCLLSAFSFGMREAWVSALYCVLLHAQTHESSITADDKTGAVNFCEIVLCPACFGRGSGWLSHVT